MKFVKISFSKKRVSLVMLVLLAGLSFKCSTSELDFIDPFEFVTEEFEEIPDVEVVDDPEPVVEEVETGEVANLQVSGEIVRAVIQVVESDESLELAPETNEVLEKVNTSIGDVVSQVFEVVDEEKDLVFNEFDEEEIDFLLDQRSVLDERQNEVLAQIADSEDIAGLVGVLPQIVLTDDFLILDETIDDIGLSLKSESGPFASTLRTLTLVGPCADVANDAFSESVAVLDGQRDGNIQTIEANYQRRLDEADQRFVDRSIRQQENLNFALASVRANAVDIVEASRKSLELGNILYAIQLRSYAYLYTNYARSIIFDWNDRSMEVIQRRRTQERTDAEAIRDARLRDIETNYNASLGVANSALETALNNCHNQGAGN